MLTRSLLISPKVICEPWVPPRIMSNRKRTFSVVLRLRRMRGAQQRPTLEGGAPPPLSRPRESAGFHLLDLVYTLGRSVEPNTDVAVTFSKLRRQILHGHSGFSCRHQIFHDLLL